MGTTINYNDTAFRTLFPAYASMTNFPQSTLQAYWNNATNYVSNVNGGCFTGGLSLNQQTQALNLMTAHLAYIAGLIQQGQVPGVMTAASIDKISITLEPPLLKNQWQYWLQSTPYGQQLIALLQVVGVGGFYVSSGLPGRAGFRGGVC